MRTPGWLGATLTLLIALIAGGIGFAIGTHTVLPTDASGAAVSAPVAWAWHGWGWGFPFFPLFGLLFLFLIVALFVGFVRRAAWGGRGWHGSHRWGPGPWMGPDGSGTGDPRQAMLDDWHRRAHGQEAQGTHPPQPPQGQPPQAPPPYGQPLYGQPSQGQPPYGQPPQGQPPSGQPPSSPGDPNGQR